MTTIDTQNRDSEFAEMNVALENEGAQGAEYRAEGAGYRLQMALIDLIDLALQIQHLRWNLVDEPTLRSQLDDLDCLVRAGSDAVADRLRQVGVAPDGTVAAVYQDLLFEPLPAGPFDAHSASSAFAPRLNQMDSRLRGSITIVDSLDPQSAALLETITNDISAWTRQLPTST
jgi:starvation-inducible DNA-binding protein